MMKLQNSADASMIGFGTYKVSDTLTSGRTKEIVLDALAVGYRYLDTAALYGNEIEIGQALKESGLNREDIFLATKVWKENLGYQATRQASIPIFHELQ